MCCFGCNQFGSSLFGEDAREGDVLEGVWDGDKFNDSTFFNQKAVRTSRGIFFLGDVVRYGPGKYLKIEKMFTKVLRFDFFFLPRRLDVFVFFFCFPGKKKVVPRSPNLGC